MATMITGGAGFIGACLAKLLIDEGDKPVIFDIAPVQGPLSEHSDRFVFEQGKGQRRIRDRKTNETWQLTELAPDGKTPEDYAIVSRLVDSATGQVIVSAAGITQYGTRAAGELLTDEELLAAALAKVPPGWQDRKLQILLQAKVYKGIPAAPTVLAVDAW